jgi:serine/threonine protein kinase
LYRTVDSQWKISDFGLSSEARSSKERVTEYTTGTVSYHAPELMNTELEDKTPNYRVDIWGFGCIIYELLYGQVAFSGNHSVSQYSTSNGKRSLQFPQFPRILNSVDGRAICILSEFIHAMLQVDSWRRPSAKDVLQVLHTHALWSRDVVWTSDCHHYIGVTRVMDALLPTNSSNIWSTVKWSPYW